MRISADIWPSPNERRIRPAPNARVPARPTSLDTLSPAGTAFCDLLWFNFLFR